MGAGVRGEKELRRGEVQRRRHSSERPALRSAAAKAERRKRWLAHGSSKLCKTLARAHGVQSGVTWGSLPASQRRVWNTLQCDAKIGGGQQPSTGSSVPMTESDARMASSGFAGFGPAGGGPAAGRLAGGDGGGGGSVRRGGDESLAAEDECSEMAAAHGIDPGVSWGSLPEALKMRWTQLACNRMRDAILRKRQRQQQQHTPAVSAAAASARNLIGNRGSVCRDMQQRHGVRIGASWGTLPLDGQSQWNRLNCDAALQ